MKVLRAVVISFLICAVVSTRVFAENLKSPNYTLVDPELGSTTGTTSSTNYKALTLSGSGIDYSQVSSSLYKVGSGHGYTFMANAPTITCFETVTTASNTQCLGLPHADGAVGECGESGCYDRAIVQIDGITNPADTLYSIELTDNNWSTVYIIDGSTHTKKPITEKTILDYKTSAEWNASPWNGTNIRSLKPLTQYQIRATALQGDFTESPAGPSKSATTGVSKSVFDIDIGAAFTDETSAPYSSAIPPVKPESYSFTSDTNIIVEISSNSQGGSQVFASGLYDGIKSPSTLYLIPSASEDLSQSSSGDGFGIQTVAKTQSATSTGLLQSGSTYQITGTNVGIIDSTERLLACSITSLSDSCSTGTNTHITGGEILLSIGIRASFDTPARNDFMDLFTFTMISSF